MSIRRLLFKYDHLRWMRVMFHLGFMGVECEACRWPSIIAIMPMLWADTTQLLTRLLPLLRLCNVEEDCKMNGVIWSSIGGDI